VIAYSFHPEAQAELEDAALFYESRMDGLGNTFANEVARVISLLRRFPDAGAPAGRASRRVLLDRFPYAVVYRHAPDAIEVIALAHQRRRPGYWRARR